MKCIKKFIAVITIMILIINPVVTYAQAGTGTITVSGGTLGGVGNRTAAIAIILSVINSLGFTIHLTQTAKDAGTTAEKWVDDMIDRWLADGAPIEVVEDIASGKGGGSGGSGSNDDGNKIGKNGKIYISAFALGLIQKFLNWLKSKGFIGHLNSGEVVNNTMAVSELELYNQNGKVWKLEFYTDSSLSTPIKLPVFFVYNGSFCVPVAYCPYSDMFANVRYVQRRNSTNITQNNVWGDTYYNNGYQYYYRILGWNNRDESINVNDVPEGFYIETNHLQNDNTLNGYCKFYFGALDGKYEEGEGAQEENKVVGDYSGSELDNPDNKYTEIDPQLLQQLAQQLGIPGNMTIPEYLQAILESLNKKADPERQTENANVTNNDTLENESTPVPEAGNYPVILPDDQTETDVEPPADSDPVVDPTKPPDPSESVPLMMFDLREYFPFCIPFDVYRLLQKLSADPVAPSYTIGFTVYGTEVNYTISLDAFSNAMVIVRRMELFVCVVGLAIASRKIFTR